MIPIHLPNWEIFVLLVIVPLAYFANSFSPWSRHLFHGKDRTYRGYFFLSIHVLHYATSAIVIAWLMARDIPARAIGLETAHFLIAMPMMLLIGFLLAQTRIDAKQTSMARQVPVRDEIFVSLLAPISLAERRAYVITCVTAGICEEFLFRGVGILSLQGAGVSAWVSVTIGALSFAAIHGRACFSIFGIYLMLKGMLYGWLFLYSQSLLLVIVLHTLWDMLLLLKPIASPSVLVPTVGNLRR